jgi:hypothetical protein
MRRVVTNAAVMLLLGASASFVQARARQALIRRVSEDRVGEVGQARARFRGEG